MDATHASGDLPTRAEVRGAIRAARDRSVPSLRPLRKSFSRRLAGASADDVLDLARRLLAAGGVPRWFVYELIHFHPVALASLDGPRLRELGEGLSSWGDVDPFAVYLAGPAWRAGQVSNAEVHAWARSPDRWWRRAALVSTIPLNRTGDGADAPRTLAVCNLLRSDRDPMVVKALSWALRELGKRDPDTAAAYVKGHEAELAARVVREVRNRLETGRKEPGRASRD